MLRPIALTFLALIAASCTLRAQGQVTGGDEGQCAAHRPVAQVVRNPARRHVGLRLRWRRVMPAQNATATPAANTAYRASPSVQCRVAVPNS